MAYMHFLPPVLGIVAPSYLGHHLKDRLACPPPLHHDALHAHSLPRCPRPPAHENLRPRFLGHYLQQRVVKLVSEPYERDECCACILFKLCVFTWQSTGLRTLCNGI